jgi:hypothetical protein
MKVKRLIDLNLFEMKNPRIAGIHNNDSDKIFRVIQQNTHS